MSSTQQKTQPVPILPRQRTESMQSTDSEILTSTPPQRRFSLSGMFGRKSSISEAFQKYSAFTINGDGFQRENYVTKVQEPAGISRQPPHEEYFLP